MSAEFEVVTSILAAASSYNLTDLATVKAELAVTDASLDTVLGMYIAQSAAVIANHCNQVFVVEVLQDKFFAHRPYRERDIQLSRWPLANYGYVSLTGNTHSTTTVDGLSTTSGLAVGQAVFGAGITPGDTIASIGVGSFSLTLGATATATGVAITTGVNVIETARDGTQTTLVPGVDYILRPQLGQITRLNSGNNSFPTRWTAPAITVQYSAGFPAIPADLVDACLRLITGRLKQRGRDPMLRTEGEPGLGQVQYWVGVQPGQTGSLPPEIAALVDNYRVPLVA